MAVLVFQTAAAGAGIIRIDLRLCALLRRLHQRIVLIRTGDLRDLFALLRPLDAGEVDRTNGIFPDAGHHAVEHVVTGDLILGQRIPVAVGRKPDALPQLIHVIDVIHPAAVDRAQQHDAFQFTHGFRGREFGFLRFIQFRRAFPDQMLQFLFIEALFRDVRFRDRCDRHILQQRPVQFLQIPQIRILILMN